MENCLLLYQVPFTAGLGILKIFKSHPFLNSILDGFLKFEEQERSYRKCTRVLSSDAPLFVPAFVRKQAANLKEPQSAIGKKQDEKLSVDLNIMTEATVTVFKSEGCKEDVPAEMPLETGVDDPNLVVRESSVEKSVATKKEDDKPVSMVLKENTKALENVKANIQPENSIKQASPVIKKMYKPVENGKLQSKPFDKIENVAEKIGSLSLKSVEANIENGRSGEGDVVTIGSMHVRVNSCNEK
jgi:hypothetical protein